MSFGVPQGSCLGPLLFSIYTSQLFDIVSHHLLQVHCYMYADNTQLYLAFKPDNNTTQLAAVRSMEACVEDLRRWMVKDKLMLNDDKTEFVLIGTKQQLAKSVLTLCRLVFQRFQTPASFGTLVRGLTVISQWLHVNKICKAAFYRLYNIARIRKYLNRQSTEPLVHALVLSHVELL